MQPMQSLQCAEIHSMLSTLAWYRARDMSPEAKGSARSKSRLSRRALRCPFGLILTNEAETESNATQELGRRPHLPCRFGHLQGEGPSRGGEPAAMGILSLSHANSGLAKLQGQSFPNLPSPRATPDDRQRAQESAKGG